MLSKNIQVNFIFFLNLFRENKLVKSDKLLNIKSINPIQKNPHIDELHSCVT